MSRTTTVVPANVPRASRDGVTVTETCPRAGRAVARTGTATHRSLDHRRQAPPTEVTPCYKRLPVSDVRLETARGPVVLASDASHYYANMHRRSPFPILYNLGDMFEGWNIVARLAGHVDRITPGHDPIVTEIYPRASDKVDAYSLHVQPSRSFAK